MNKGMLIIAVPAVLVSVFWLTMRWGWRAAAAGCCLELAAGFAFWLYASKGERTS
jgi:hypothetical protein